MWFIGAEVDQETRVHPLLKKILDPPLNLLCKGQRTVAYIKVYQSTQKHFVLSYLIPGLNMVRLGIKQQAKFRVR